MQIKIDTTTKTITLFEKIRIGELLNELDKMGIEFNDWIIEFEPIVIYKERKLDILGPYSPVVTPPWIIGDQPYTQPYTNPWTTGTPYEPKIWYSYNTNTQV